MIELSLRIRFGKVSPETPGEREVDLYSATENQGAPRMIGFTREGNE